MLLSCANYILLVRYLEDKTASILIFIKLFYFSRYMEKRQAVYEALCGMILICLFVCLLLFLGFFLHLSLICLIFSICYQICGHLLLMAIGIRGAWGGGGGGGLQVSPLARQLPLRISFLKAILC